MGKNQEKIYFSYIILILVLFGICLYISYVLSSLEIGKFLPLFLLVACLLLEKYRSKKYEKSIVYIFLGTILLFIFELEETIKNNILMIPFLLTYLYLLLPFIVEYKKQKNYKTKMFVMGKIIFFLLFFFISLLRIARILL